MRQVSHGGVPGRRPLTPRLMLPTLLGLVGLLVQTGNAVGQVTPNAALTTTRYDASSEAIANPERGFYHQPGDCNADDFAASTLAGYRTNEKITLVMCIFYLAEFKTSPISQAQLERFQRQAAAAREAGLKMIVRFAYTKSHAGDDAPLSRVQSHLDQLAPYLSSNADVIAVVQSGFVGAYGEGYYTQNFGNAGVISPQNWADRKAVVEKLLSIVPANRHVQVRTPAMKRRMYGTAAATAHDVTARRTVARVGHHNDCFLADATDQGTYHDTAVEYPYLAADTRYVPMGGETCGDSANPPRTDCPTALRELGMFHYSYLNRDWSPAVLATWSAGGCMPQVDRQLGYRLALDSVTTGREVTRGTNLPFRMTMMNEGWSSAMHHRPIRLVLRNTATQAVYKLPLWNTEHLGAGSLVHLSNQHLTIPSTTPAGTYELLLSLADPAPSLANRPEYAVRLANSGLWEPETGFNRLLRTLKVK